VTQSILSTSDRRIRLVLLIGSIAAFGFWFGISLLAVIFSFIVMLVLHELGHFLVARWAGMQVTEAFVGFGPRVWSVTRGETEYGVKAIPAGAYVKISGMTNLEEVDEGDEYRTYRQQSYPKRLAVALAGSATQFLFAGLLLVGIFVWMGRPDNDTWVVHTVSSGSAAAEAGVLPGDRIVSLGSRPVPDFARFGELVRSQPSRLVTVELERDGARLVRSATVGERLTVSGAAAFPGLRRGDQIIAIDGVTTPTWSDLERLVKVGTSHRLIVRRADDAVIGMTLIPRRIPAESAAVEGFFGVSASNPMVGLGPVQAVFEASVTLGDLLWESTAALLRFFTPGGISGFVEGAVDSGADRPAPVVATDSTEDDSRLLSIYGAVRLGDAALDSGFHIFLWFVVLVNVFVGIFNLLPLLPLDGGHIAIATYERIRSRGGKRYVADAGKLQSLTGVVVVFLIALALVALYRDLVDLPDFG